MERDDLRVFGGPWPHFRPVTDADLAPLGYVKLDAETLVLLREARSTDRRVLADDLLEQVGRRVLAAIDQEATG